MFHRSRGEAGFALPTAMFFILGMLAILSIGAVAAVNTQRGTIRDSNSKSALAVAESGANIAILRYSEYRDQLSVAEPCLDNALGATARTTALVSGPDGTLSGGWCPAVSDPSSGPFVYWVRPSEQGGKEYLEIVSQGNVDGVSRRVKVGAEAQSGSFYVGAEQIVGINSFYLKGNSKVNAGVGSNGRVEIIDSSQICGPVRIGPGTPSPVGGELSKWVSPDSMKPYSNGTGGGVCPDPANIPHPGTRDFPPVELPAGLTAATSATSRFFSLDGKDMPDWYIGTPENRRRRWNPDTRTLTIDGGNTLRISGTQPYLLCRLVLTGGGKIIAEAPGQSVSIFFDSPERCPSLSGSPKEQLEISGDGYFGSNGYVPGLFFVGSDNEATRIKLTGGSAIQHMVVYAPRTDLSASGDFKFNGALIGKTFSMVGGSKATSNFDGTNYELPVAAETSGFQAHGFGECNAEWLDVTSTAPEAGCPLGS